MTRFVINIPQDALRPEWDYFGEDDLGVHTFKVQVPKGSRVTGPGVYIQKSGRVFRTTKCERLDGQDAPPLVAFKVWCTVAT